MTDIKLEYTLDLAKLRSEIEKMEDGPQKARALHLWYLLISLFLPTV